jgi:hypothetical protein
VVAHDGRAEVKTKNTFGAPTGTIEQRNTATEGVCEWWANGWFICKADANKGGLSGQIQVGAAFPMSIEEACVMSLALQRAACWVREEAAHRAKMAREILKNQIEDRGRP